MLKLFRHIRQNLLNDGKTSKYFKYAIGEIVLVVIGILIALQINTWNENQKAGKQETLYLHRLLTENKEDIHTFNANIKNLELGLASIVQFSEALKNEQVQDSLLVKSANDFFKYGSIYPIFTYSSSTFDDLSSTGNLKLINNIHLRDNIVKHYADYKQTSEWIQIAVDWALPIDAPFTYENDIMKFEPSTAFLFPKQTIESLAKELKNKKMTFISNTAAHYWINTDCINQLKRLITETSILIGKIEHEIKVRE